MALWATFLEASRAALTLSLDRLAAVPDLPQLGPAALLIVLLAGVSETLGESVVLFINRVPPRRFVASLLVSGALFAFTYLFLAASVYSVARWLFSPQAAFSLIAVLVGVSFAPRMFGFIEFVPYFGQPLATLLQAWSLLALLAAAAALGADPLQALVAVVLGAVLLAALQRTVGRPFGYLATRLRWLTAGVRLREPREALASALVDVGDSHSEERRRERGDGRAGGAK